MNDADNFTLVPRPPGALEKAKPGAKRILSGMVAETLSLARKSRPLRVVLVDDDSGLLEFYAETFREWFRQVDFVSFDKPLKALEELEHHNPDLLITGVKMPKIDGYQVIERLFARKIQYPILVLTAYSPAKVWVEDYARRGFNVRYFGKPGNEQELEELRRVIEAILQIPRDPTEKPAKVAQPPRPIRPSMIVVVYNEEGPRASIETILRHFFNNAELQLFEDSREACEALSGAPVSRITPDLLITTDAMPGMRGADIVERLAYMGVTYPIIVVSTWNDSEKWVQQYASRGLNVKFMSMPFDIANFLKVVAASLKIPPEKDL